MLKKNPEQSDIDTLCEGALGIYNQYLSEKVSLYDQKILIFLAIITVR